MEWVGHKRGRNEMKKRSNVAISKKCKIGYSKVIMQGKLFQRCTNLLFCRILSLGGYVNTRWMSKPDKGSIFHLKNR